MLFSPPLTPSLSCDNNQILSVSMNELINSVIRNESSQLNKFHPDSDTPVPNCCRPDGRHDFIQLYTLVNLTPLVRLLGYGCSFNQLATRWHQIAMQSPQRPRLESVVNPASHPSMCTFFSSLGGVLLQVSRPMLK